jgi:hypothetical protein
MCVCGLNPKPGWHPGQNPHSHSPASTHSTKPTYHQF